MSPPPDLPNLHVGEGARRLALKLLDGATASRSRLSNPSDAEALHDYRVALRRLRSCLRAYRKFLRSTLKAKTETRLRRLARATNRSRDLEVHLAWLSEQRNRVAERDRQGVAWMVERLTAEQDLAREKMLDLDERLFPKVQSQLARQLNRFRATIHLDTGPRRWSTAAVTARRVRAEAARLKERLRSIRGYTSGEAIHRARIAAKHLRYLLEPFAKGISGGQEVVDRLKALQDGFGDVHDAQVFAVELEGALPEAEGAPAAGTGLIPGLESVMAVLRARGLRAYEQTARDWLGGSPIRSSARSMPSPTRLPGWPTAIGDRAEVSPDRASISRKGGAAGRDRARIPAGGAARRARAPHRIRGRRTAGPDREGGLRSHAPRGRGGSDTGGVRHPLAAHRGSATAETAISGPGRRHDVGDRRVHGPGSRAGRGRAVSRARRPMSSCQRGSDHTWSER